MATSGTTFDMFEIWLSHMDDPAFPSSSFYKPMADWRLKQLDVVRALNRELAEMRLLAEEEEATEAAEKDTEESVEDQPAQVIDGDEEEEIPQAIETTRVSKNEKFAVGTFMPAKKANADESLFKKYA